jgi:hypothetical protein
MEQKMTTEESIKEELAFLNGLEKTLNYKNQKFKIKRLKK